MSRPSIRVLLALFACALCLSAQAPEPADNSANPIADPDLKVELRPLTEDLVEVFASAKKASLREVFIELAGQSNRELRMDSGVLPIISDTRVELNLRNMELEECALLLATTASLTVEIKEDAIHLHHRKKAGSAEGGEEARLLAGEAWLRSGIHTFQQSEQGALYRIGGLFFAGQQWGRALDAYKAFLTSLPNDPRVARARLMAGYAALKLDRTAEARSLLARIEDEDPNSRDILPATLLLAQVFMAEGRKDEALVRLRRVINEVRDPVMRSEAILIRTRMWFDLEDWNEALQSIEEYDFDLERKVPPHVSLASLARGLARQKAGEVDRAFIPLQFAWLQMEDPGQRLEAILALAKGWLIHDEHLIALQTLDLGDQLTLEPWQRLRLLEAKAEAERQFLLLNRLEKTWREMAELGLMEHVADRARTLSALEGLAQLLFEQERYADARRIFTSLSRLPELNARSLVMLARCEIRTRDYERALLTLDALDPSDPQVDIDEVVQLRGECWLALGDAAKAADAFRGQMVKENER